MEKYYKLEKINRQKFEIEGYPMYFQTLEEAKKKPRKYQMKNMAIV